ncbi:MAG TPA: hypothetical protein PLB00_04075 [Pseudomonadota bacterium]|jgi:hypothetical protein|nr:hypothetical protein [Pseudomonadota bacterium]
MFRPALSFLIALSALLVSATVTAKTSVSSLQQPELPCPANRNDAGDLGEAATIAPATTTPGSSAVTKSGASKASRQRWKALLPGTLKSTS